MSSRLLQLAVGLDLSTQQLKVVAIDITSLETFYEKSLVFDSELAHYKTTRGVYHNDQQHEVYSPVEMWIEAVDVIFKGMREDMFPFEKVVAISGAGQQHASVFWSRNAEKILCSLDAHKSLREQVFPHAFSHPYSPNWQDHSSTAQCAFIEHQVGGPANLAIVTGSKAHHRFTGPQILKFREKNPESYAETTRISLTSSFLASLFLGRIAPIDISDVCGMNLWDIQKQNWSTKLLEIVGGNAEHLLLKLGQVETDGASHLGKIHSYFTSRYNLPQSCIVVPFTGDNPATIASLPLSPMDSIISLGTSTTLLLITERYTPSPLYHIFNHPTTKGLYFAMLCYKNGSHAREQVRNEIDRDKPNNWDSFNSALHSTKPLGDPARKLGFYFPLPEIIPDAPSGIWRFTVDNSKVKKAAKWSAEEDARAIVESQALSMRLHARPLLAGGKPRRLYFVGGASQNDAIVEVMSQILGSQEGTYRLTEGVTAGACARGSAIKAAWALDGKGGMGFDEFMRARWDMKGRLDKLAIEDNGNAWEEYGLILDSYRQCEEIIMSEKWTP